jgi:2-hydroxy-3-keto-5-methylthiopentenyl-1-phosphate phosphatase
MFELANASVFLDFDGTVTTRDVGVHLLERVGTPAWRGISEQYSRGEIGSRECSVEEWALIRGDEATLRTIAGEVPVDPGFEPLVAELRAAGAEVMVVSDGFGFYVDEVCAPLRLPVLTNAVDFVTGELVFPHEDRCCPCSTCGVCKQAPIKDARGRGRDTVLVGDGISDRKAALLADVVFAKGSLASWCAATDVPYVAFTTLDDVRRALT